ncbi:hypothetical protein Acr_06g0015240 [Actinidia rufa]|uniref:diacylglycerol O-acyltransferase n=1 Tax=Actinidia rufa TaxID=165716 RepID=A0A7J0ESX6_9ERIC|nr:hypothetical protein Acr_06g0015240 [Actinidia rufa]
MFIPTPQGQNTPVGVGSRERRASDAGGAALPPPGDEPNNPLRHRLQKPHRRRRPPVGNRRLRHGQASPLLQPHGSVTAAAASTGAEPTSTSTATSSSSPTQVGDPDSGDDEAVNYYAADMAVSSPLATDKPLWEFHILLAHNCILLRVHHALGDGISLMSMFLECCRRADGSDRRPSIGSVGTSERTDGGGRSRAWRRVSAAVWWTVVFVVGFVLRTLWVRDQRTAVSGGAGVSSGRGSSPRLSFGLTT